MDYEYLLGLVLLATVYFSYKYYQLNDLKNIFRSFNDPRERSHISFVLNKYNINPDEEHFNRFFTEYILWIDGLFFLASSESPYLFKLRKKVSKGDSTKLFLLETLTTFISKYKEKNDSRMKEWDDNNVPVKSDHYKWLLCFEAGLMKCAVKEDLLIQHYSFFSKEDLLKMAEDNERKSESSHFNPW